MPDTKDDPPQEAIQSTSLQELLDARGEALQLELLTPDLDLDREILDADVSSPGMALAGYTERFTEGRMQVFGETELSYLGELSPERSRDLLEGVLLPGVPAVFVTKGLAVPDLMIEVASARGVPILRSGLTTREFYRRIKPHLESALAPFTNMHGTLADVHGVGLLFVGASGVGKSECVLDLVERGHRLVADDLVVVSRRGHDILIGQGYAKQRHHMEIRGVGIIDVQALFGIRATRQQKRVEVIVHLERWDDTHPYTRTGLDPEEDSILGVSIPRLTIPLNPGKNITVISEVIAMNHLLKYSGVDSAVEFDRRLKEEMSPSKEYLEEDYE